MTMMHGRLVRLDNLLNTNYIITKPCKVHLQLHFLHDQHHSHFQVLQSTQSTSHNSNKSHHRMNKSKSPKKSSS